MSPHYWIKLHHVWCDYHSWVGFLTHRWLQGWHGGLKGRLNQCQWFMLDIQLLVCPIIKIINHLRVNKYFMSKVKDYPRWVDGNIINSLPRPHVWPQTDAAWTFSHCLSHYALWTHAHNDLRTYFKASGRTSVSSLKREWSKRAVKSLGSSSLSCRQGFARSALLAVSGRKW